MSRVLVYEPIDPTGESLKWLVSQGVQLIPGPPMWQSPYQPFNKRELIEQASGPTAWSIPRPSSIPPGRVSCLCIPEYVIPR